MGLWNCPNCWDNPCTCGTEYEHWNSNLKMNLMKNFFRSFTTGEQDEIMIALQEIYDEDNDDPISQQECVKFCRDRFVDDYIKEEDNYKEEKEELKIENEIEIKRSDLLILKNPVLPEHEEELEDEEREGK